MAHAQMLAKIGLLATEEAAALVEVLNELKQAAQEGRFTIEEEHEDMHSKIEHVLTERLGDLGKRFIPPVPVTTKSWSPCTFT